MNFPDLLALPPEQMTPAIKDAVTALGLRDDDSLGFGLKNVVGLTRARDFGAILFAMRDGARTKDKLCAALPPEDANDCDGELGLLATAGYAKPTADGNWMLLVPVFDASDRPMLNSALALSRSVITDWLAQNYGPMRRELFRLTAVRQGIPYTAMYSQIWHELFGLRDARSGRRRLDGRSAGPERRLAGLDPRRLAHVALSPRVAIRRCPRFVCFASSL